VVKGQPTEWGTCSRTVELYMIPIAVACWENTIAVSLRGGDIVTLDGITGRQTAILSGHTGSTRSLAFLPDGTSLVSGSDDGTIKLWDVQTGGVVKTFCGHKHWVYSVSISADCTMIASGSADKTVRLWNIQTEECHCVIEQQDRVEWVGFSPIEPPSLISVASNKVWQWSLNGHQIRPAHDGSHIAFSLDGTQVVLCYQEEVVVQKSDSGAIVAKYHLVGHGLRHGCFSPDGKLIAVSSVGAAYVWDITSSDPHPIKTFHGHGSTITRLAFSSPSTLISSSADKSVKIWQIGALQADPVTTNKVSALVLSITLQAKDGIAISVHSDGIVRTWDILTGLCKSSFQTPARQFHWSDAQLINSQLIVVWYHEIHVEDADGYNWHSEKKIHIWDAEKGESIASCMTQDSAVDIRISGDGSKVFCLYEGSIQALSMQTGEVMGEVKFEQNPAKQSLIVDGLRVWVNSPSSVPLGWDFGTQGSSPIQLSNVPQLHLDDAKVWDVALSRIKDRVTGRVIFQLGGRFAKPAKAQWDGQYLVTGYESGEVLILYFNHVLL